MDNEYMCNSHKSKEGTNNEVPEKRVTPVVTGAKLKKKNSGAKLADVFISEDVGKVKSYILMGILVPTIKQAIYDIVTNGTGMALFGETDRRKKSSNAGRVSYGNYYRDRDNRRDRDEAPRRHSSFDYEDIIFDSRGEAETVLDALNDIINQYGMASVGDLYDLANVSTNNYTINNYGWSDLRGTSPARLRDGGYILKLPRAVPLDR